MPASQQDHTAGCGMVPNSEGRQPRSPARGSPTTQPSGTTTDDIPSTAEDVDLTFEAFVAQEEARLRNARRSLSPEPESNFAQSSRSVSPSKERTLSKDDSDQIKAGRLWSRERIRRGSEVWNHCVGDRQLGAPMSKGGRSSVQVDLAVVMFGQD
ncbi:hypothetical protein PMZ80_007755 [Knufia obscura]|uniref:Uncharacterized protein n=2 Tax=Knufia TaxID=430999 RepID=A0AAN8I6A6_9EURO|nr:hypothetical protein PMZ80_007755 [Knufia obscura]KAK5954289.1 hypothetical protein OHC33_004862 [Knufia fluminis]